MVERYADPFVRWSTAARAFVVASTGVALVLGLLSVSAAVAGPAGVAAGAFFGWLGSQVSVEVDNRTIVARDLLRVTRIPWEDVVDVEIVPTSHVEYGRQPFGTFVYAGVRRRDGSLVPLRAMPLWDDKRGRRHWGAVERWQARARLPR